MRNKSLHRKKMLGLLLLAVLLLVVGRLLWVLRRLVLGVRQLLWRVIIRLLRDVGLVGWVVG